MVDAWDLLLRLLVAALLGAAIGLEREFSDQPAGFRTHLMVSLGAALFTISGAYGLSDFSENTLRDPTRIAAQVVTGIGFLGAGAIVQQGLSIRGLTTAASLWVTAAVGLAMGFGYWEGAVATTGLAVVALYGLKRLEREVIPAARSARPKLELVTGASFSLADLETTLAARDAELTGVRSLRDGDTRRITASVQLEGPGEFGDLIESISELPGVERVEWRR